jgi:hypothetical protein
MGPGRVTVVLQVAAGRAVRMPGLPGGLFLLVSVATSVACNLASHSCTELYQRCDTTSVTIQAPNDAWVAGSYTLAMTVNGVPQQCTMNVPNPPAATQGTCSASGPGYVWATTLSLAGVCPSPPIVCNDAGACGGMVSSADCIAGHFTMQLVIGDRLGADAQPPFAEPVSLDLSVDGTTLLNETISPMATTNGTNGTGCGTCTNASDTLMLSGGLPNVSDGGGAAPSADTGTE